MSSIFDYSDPIITKMREIHVPKSESQQVVNGKLVLSELPDEFYRVQLSGGDVELWIETDNPSPTDNLYHVDYTTGIITVDSIHNTKRLQMSYYGRGTQYFPASRVYTRYDNGEVVETLDELIENGETALDALNELAEKLQEVDDAIADANQALNIANQVATQFNNDENDRKAAEIIREENENQRIANENTRQENETERITRYNNFVNLGEFSLSITYQPYNIVSYQGSSFMCILESVGNLPSDTTYWKPLSLKGDKGATLTPKGAYDNNILYEVGDLVTYDLGIYNCIKQSLGNDPTDTEYWELFLAGGGDMRRDIYDTNYNGVVDDSERLGGQLPSYYAKQTDLQDIKSDVTQLQTDLTDTNLNVTQNSNKIGDLSNLQTITKDNLVDAVNEVQQEINTHSVNYINHIPYAVATGSANTYSVTLNPAPAGYVEGMALAVKINVANTGASTINVNGLGAKSIKKANGNDVASGNLKAGSIYTLRYNGTNFILQGEGGEYGTAQAQHVLEGYTIGTENGLVEGTMTNRGAVNQTITTQGEQYTIPAGYHNGSGKVTANFSNLIAENIKKGVNVGGVVGTLDPKFDLSKYKNVAYSSNYFLIAVTENDELWIKNAASPSYVYKIDLNGTLLTSYDGNGYSILDIFGNEYAHVSGEVFRIYDQNHSLIRQISVPHQSISYIKITSDRYVTFGTNSDSNRYVAIFNKSGTLLHSIHFGGQLRVPRGLAVFNESIIIAVIDTDIVWIDLYNGTKYTNVIQSISSILTLLAK